MKIRYATISKEGRRSNNEDFFVVMDQQERGAFGVSCVMGWVVTLAGRWRARRWLMLYRHTGSSMRRKGIVRLKSWGLARRRRVLSGRRREW